MQDASNSSGLTGDAPASASRRARVIESLVSHLAVLAVVAASIAAVVMRSPAPQPPVATAPAGDQAAPHQG